MSAEIGLARRAYQGEVSPLVDDTRAQASNDIGRCAGTSDNQAAVGRIVERHSSRMAAVVVENDVVAEPKWTTLIGRSRLDADRSHKRIAIDIHLFGKTEIVEVDDVGFGGTTWVTSPGDAVVADFSRALAACEAVLIADDSLIDVDVVVIPAASDFKPWTAELQIEWSAGLEGVVVFNQHFSNGVELVHPR